MTVLFGLFFLFQFVHYLLTRNDAATSDRSDGFDHDALNGGAVSLLCDCHTPGRRFVRSSLSRHFRSHSRTYPLTRSLDSRPLCFSRLPCPPIICRIQTDSESAFPPPSPASRVVEQSGLSKESFLFIAVYFAQIFAYWSFMASVIPYLQTEFKYSVQSSYVYFLLVGAAFVAAFGVYRLLKYYLPDTRLVSLSLLVSGAGTPMPIRVSFFGVIRLHLLMHLIAHPCRCSLFVCDLDLFPSLLAVDLTPLHFCPPLPFPVSRVPQV